MASLSTARARSWDRVQRELADDERYEIEARGGVAPNADGTSRTVVTRPTLTTYRARCSCSWEGTEVTSADYATALAERNAHARSCK